MKAPEGSFNGHGIHSKHHEASQDISPGSQSLSHNGRVSVTPANTTHDGRVLHLNREYCKAVTARRAGHLDQPSPSVLGTDGKKDAE